MTTAYANDPLLLDLYRCCAEPAAWRTVLDTLCSELGVRSAVIQAVDFADGYQGQSYWWAHDSRTEQGRYEALISDGNNPRLDRRRSRPVIGKLVGDDQLFTTGEDKRHQLRLQRQLAELGFGRFLGALLPVGGSRFVAMAVHRDVRDNRDFSLAEKLRLTALLPHVSQAAMLSQTIGSGRRLEQVLGACLDRWQCGLVVCDAAGTVQWMNRPAREQIGQGNMLHVEAGRLCAYGPRDAQLRSALASQGHVPGRTTFLALERDRQRLHLAFQPLMPAQGSAKAGDVLVMMSDGNLAGEIPATALAALFDLTEAESRLTSALVQGDTLEQYAQRRGVSIGTVRYQLKQVLSKTGTNRQSELMRKILCSAAAHAAGFQSASVH